MPLRHHRDAGAPGNLRREGKPMTASCATMLLVTP
jgi:hypothetical protein